MKTLETDLHPVLNVAAAHSGRTDGMCVKALIRMYYKWGGGAFYIHNIPALLPHMLPKDNEAPQQKGRARTLID
jgi:hypothetical protein